MRIMTNDMQQECFKRIVDVVKALASEDSQENNYAINDMWQIARLVGGRHMVDALEGNNYYARPMRERMGNAISDSIDALDSILDR